MRKRLRQFIAPVRIRLTLVATVLIAVSLLGASAALALTLNHLLTGAVDRTSSVRAAQLAQTIADDGLAGVTTAMTAPGADIDFVQILDPSGTIAVASAPEFDERPLTGPVPVGTVARIENWELGPEYRAAVVGTAAPDGTAYTVIAAYADRHVDVTVAKVAVLCSIFFPFAVLGTAALTYLLVGRALRPVDELRARAAEITGGDLSTRLPVPDTGDEIAALATTMNDMLGRVETARRRQSQFVNDASHELNSPLTSILGNLELSSNTGEPVDVDTVRGLLLPEAHRLRTLVADLLFLARADERGVPIRRIELDLDDVVGAEVERLRAVSELTVHSEIVAARLIGDPAQLDRALRNLTENALAHARTTVTVTMSVDPAGREVTVAVADDGAGIGAADRDRVFTRFVRLDAARQRRQGGSGLGLAIVAEIVAAHAGRVAVDAAPGGGTVVSMVLPLHEPA